MQAQYYSRQVASQRSILLHAGIIDTTKPRACLEEITQVLQHEEASQTTDLFQWMLHVDGPLEKSVKKEINELLHPYYLGQYIPNHSFIVVRIY